MENGNSLRGRLVFRVFMADRESVSTQLRNQEVGVIRQLEDW